VARPYSIEPVRATPEALLASVALENHDAFATLYRQTSAKLFGICLRVLTERTDCDCLAYH
jgi:hypothetical protein